MTKQEEANDLDAKAMSRAFELKKFEDKVYYEGPGGVRFYGEGTDMIEKQIDAAKKAIAFRY